MCLCIAEQTRQVYERKLLRLMGGDDSLMQDHDDVDYVDDEDDEEEEMDLEGEQLAASVVIYWKVTYLNATVLMAVTKLERERAKKMGLFSDWRLLDLGAVTGFRSGHPASIRFIMCLLSSCVSM